MITLQAAQTLRGKAGTASAVTYTIIGDEVSGGADSFKTLAQGQLSDSVATLYTVPGSTAALIKTIFLSNTTASNVGAINFFIGGSAAANQIITILIPANGSAIYDGTWHIFDGSGNLQYVGGTGPSGTNSIGTTTTGDPGSSANVTNSGTASAGVWNFTVPAGSTWRNGSGAPSNAVGRNGDYYLNTHASVGTGDVYLRSGGTYSVVGNIRGAQGIQGNPGVVQTVTSADGTLVAGGTAADPTLRRAALTGDITAAAGSNATAVKSDLALPGNPTTTTQSPGNNSTRIATTAFVETRATAAQSAAESTASTALNNHINDTEDAHDASAISVVPTLQFPSDDTVQETINTFATWVQLLLAETLFRIDAKGDIIAGAGDNTTARRPVGADGARLIADSSHASGLGWDTTDMATQAELNAVDSAALHKAGAETASGMKTFTPGITLGGVASPTHTAGKLVYDTDNESLTFFNNDSAVAHQVGQESWIRVRNVTGSTIANGTAVYINGSNAGPPVLPTIAPARANLFSTTLAVGLTTESIPNNGIGYVTTAGLVRDIDTSAFTAGQAIYLSTSVAGGLQSTIAQSPHFRFRMGVVASSHATTGSIFVDPDPALNGFNAANVWYDVTCWSETAANNLVGDDSTDNAAKWATLFAALPVGATVYFPPGTYRTSTAFAITGDKHLRILGAGQYNSIIKSTSATADGFSIAGGQYWYNSFEGLRFETMHLNGTPKTAGSAILISTVGLGANAQQAGINIRNCSFHNWFKAIYCIADSGVNGPSQGPGNLSVWENLDITISGSTGPTGARGIHINAAGVNNIISNCFINLGFPPFQVANTACIEVNASGAIQMTGMEIIGGTNCILLSADATTGTNNSVAAIYATNCFLDQSAGSTLKIAGPNIVNRCKFVQCGITGGNVAGATAVEIASTGTGAAGTGTAKADGVDFFDCDIYPNGGSGTTNGFLITGAQGVTINGCRISGWTNGIAVTPSVSNGYTKLFVINNKIGATNNFTTPNTNGLVLNAGSFQYGAIVVTGNDFAGSTTPLTENATVQYSNQELYEANIGIVNRWIGPPTTATQTLATSTTGFINGTTIPIPTNGFRIGSTFRWMVPIQKTATGTTYTVAIRYGTTNTFAGDTVNIATFSFTGSAVADSGLLTVSMTVTAIGGSATAIAYAHMDRGAPSGTTGLNTTATGTLVNGTMTAFNSGLTAPFLNLALSASTINPTFLAPVVAEVLR